MVFKRRRVDRKADKWFMEGYWDCIYGGIGVWGDFYEGPSWWTPVYKIAFQAGWDNASRDIAEAINRREVAKTGGRRRLSNPLTGPPELKPADRAKCYAAARVG